MPENGLSTGDWQRVNELLDELLELSPSAQEARLEELTKGDPLVSEELRRLVESDRGSGLLDRPASESLDTLIQEAAAESDPIPERIGPYRVVRELGRGGMGVVYLAERSDGEFEQSVALKLVKRGLDTDAILARFRRERQILARLQHPAIARLFDGGAADDGRPYFAMEMVDGDPITQACDRKRIRVRDRLELFQSACEAVQYAHGQLVVHRDLKPSNILYERSGGLKLLDFGIARLLNDDSDDATRMTAVGLRPLTPAYAAPEQLAGEPATVATDVFALGVILCELLTGLRPEGQARASGLATSISPDGTSALERSSARGGVDPPTLSRRLSGDLDAIVSKAVHAEPGRRYPSAEALSRDVGRHLSGLPVEAAPDSTLYRTRKFVTRHRVGVASALALATALLLGIAGTAWQARQKALEARKAREVRDFALGLFAAVDPSLAQGEEVTALELVAQGAARVHTELDGQPEVQAEMEQLLGEVNWNLGRAEVGLELIERALGRLPDTTVSPGRASTLRSKGGILVDLGRPEEAEPFLKAALAMHERTLGSTHPEVAEDLDRLALFHLARGQVEEARASAERSLTVRLTSLGEDHVETADSYNNLGVLARQAGDYEAAEKGYRQALAIRQAQLGDRHPETLDSLGNFATLLYFRGRYEAARERFAEIVDIHDEVFGTEHPSTVRARNNLAVMLTQLARYDEAEPLLSEVLAFWAEATGLDHPNALGTRSNLSLIERMRGSLQGAAASDRIILDRAVGILGEGHPLSARFSNRLAASLREAAKLEEAMQFVESSLSTNESAFGAKAPQVATDLHLIGLIARDQGQLDRARESLERALAIRTDNHGLQSVFTAETQSELGELLRRTGDLDGARELLRSGLETHRKELPERHPAVARSAWLLARALIDAGNLAAADSLLTEAQRAAAEVFGEDSWRAAAITVDLGLCKLLSGDAEAGSRLARSALGRLEDRLGPDHPLHRTADSRVRELSGSG